MSVIPVPVDPFNIHAVASLISSLALLVTALAGLIVAMRTRKEVKEVHGIVNSTAQAAEARTDQLAKTITDSGQPLPPRLPPPDQS